MISLLLFASVTVFAIFKVFAPAPPGVNTARLLSLEWPNKACLQSTTTPPPVNPTASKPIVQHEVKPYQAAPPRHVLPPISKSHFSKSHFHSRWRGSPYRPKRIRRVPHGSCHCRE